MSTHEEKQEAPEQKPVFVSLLAEDLQTAAPLMSLIEGQAAASVWWSRGTTDLYGVCASWAWTAPK